MNKVDNWKFSNYKMYLTWSRIRHIGMGATHCFNNKPTSDTHHCFDSVSVDVDLLYAWVHCLASLRRATQSVHSLVQLIRRQLLVAEPKFRMKDCTPGLLGALRTHRRANGRHGSTDVLESYSVTKVIYTSHGQ